jgi:hydrogenase expression/formation protein HypC
MCLAVPLKITEINGLDAVAEYSGVSRRVRLDFIKDPKVGEYVMVHAGFAIERVSEDQAFMDWEAAAELEDALASL